MSTTVDLAGLNKLQEKLATLTHIDCTDLMLSWEIILEEDNRRGILAGLDKDGIPMTEVRYRPKDKNKPGLRVTKPPKGKKNETIRAMLARFRLGEKANARKGEATMMGPYASGLHNNLTSAQYSLLGGPPLAPRDQFSRVITNYKTDHAELRPGYWAVTFWWEDVVSTKGVPFLRYHFHSVGATKLPRRDLAGIRPAGVAKAQDALRNWARDKIHTHFE